MRSKIVIVATVVVSFALASQMAAADQVQEQLRLMEQRMAEMEDRLQATSEELRSAKETVDEQQGMLSQAGFTNNEEDQGIRSGIGRFFEQVDVNGVVAASYNYRLKGPGDNNLENVGLFRHQNADTFALDQLWLTFDKAPTEEDRAGFHADLVYGETAVAQNGGRSRQDVLDSTGNPTGDTTNSGSDDFLLQTAYVSYLAPVGSGVLTDLGEIPTVLGAESLQANANFNITQGLVWGLQPVTYTGLQLSTTTDGGLTFTAGVVNDIYDGTSVSISRDKAYLGQVAYATDDMAIAIGAILGKNSNGGLTNESGESCQSGDECKTAIFNVVATAQPTENVSLWMDYTYVRNFGDDIDVKGDAHGIAVAGRVGITDETGVAARVEYVRMENNFLRSLGSNGDTGEVVSATLTGDHALTDCLKVRAEARYDINLSNSPLFAIGSNSGSGSGNSSGTRDKQLVLLGELIYEF